MKLLLHLVPRFGNDDRLPSLVVAAGERLAAGLGVADPDWNAMLRVAQDPFGKKTLFRASLEFLDVPEDAAAVAASVGELSESFDAWLHADLSLALFGEERIFIEAKSMPIRMQYVMRRMQGLSREAYREHYEQHHSQIGLRTPGISGYAQFYVDAQATRLVAGTLGFAGAGVDSVSQLYLESVDDFMAAVTTSPIGGDALADERTFVDRRNSVDFFSHVLGPEARAAVHATG